MIWIHDDKYENISYVQKDLCVVGLVKKSNFEEFNLHFWYTLEEIEHILKIFENSFICGKYETIYFYYSEEGNSKGKIYEVMDKMKKVYNNEENIEFLGETMIAFSECLNCKRIALIDLYQKTIPTVLEYNVGCSVCFNN